MSSWTEVVRRVCDGDVEGVLTVSRGAGGLGVVISTESEVDRDCWGTLNIVMSCAIAEQLGHALIAAAKECEG